MVSFWQLFLQHLLTIWSQYFVSPYIWPTILLLLMQWREFEGAPNFSLLWNISRRLIVFALLSLYASLILGVVEPWGVRLDFAVSGMAQNALDSYFPAANAIEIDTTRFSGDTYVMFVWMFLGSFFFYYRRSFRKDFIAWVLVGTLCNVLAYAIQSWIYHFGLGGGRQMFFESQAFQQRQDLARGFY